MHQQDGLAMEMRGATLVWPLSPKWIGEPPIARVDRVASGAAELLVCAASLGWNERADVEQLATLDGAHPRRREVVQRVAGDGLATLAEHVRFVKAAYRLGRMALRGGDAGGKIEFALVDMQTDALSQNPFILRREHGGGVEELQDTRALIPHFGARFLRYAVVDG